MTRRLAALALSLAIASSAAADFGDVARRIEAGSGMTRAHVPGLWLARIATWIAAPEGVHDLRVVSFESSSARRPFDAASIMRSSLGSEWQPIVRSTDHRTGEQAVIYARPRGASQISLMVFAVDSEESVLTEVQIDAERLSEYIAEETAAGEAASRTAVTAAREP